MLEEQAARQQQVRRRSHTMEELREEFQQQGTALQDLSQKVGFYQQGLLSEEAVLERTEVELAEWQEEYQSVHKEANRSSKLEEQAALTYQVELLAAQDDVRKLKKSLVDVSVQRSETAAKQREDAQQVRHREQELAARASQLEMRCKAQEHQLQIAMQSRKSEVESEDRTGSSLENMCERIRGDCYRELESIELSAALAQQEAFELKEAQLQMEIKHDVLLEEVSQWRSEGLEAAEYSRQLARLNTELARVQKECEGLRCLEVNQPHADLVQNEEATAFAEALQLELFDLKEEMLQLEQQSVADADAAQRSQRTIAALRTQNEKLRHRYDEARLSESEATAMAIDLALKSRGHELFEEMASQLDAENYQAAAAMHLQRAAAAESIAHARAAELAEQKEILRQECRRLRDQNVTLVRQIHEGLAATALQDIKIVAAARVRQSDQQ